MWLGLIAYTASLHLPGDDLDTSRTDIRTHVWLSLLSLWIPALVCWLAATRNRGLTGQLSLAAAAVTCYALGATYSAIAPIVRDEPLFPSQANFGALMFYPVILVSLGLLVRHQRRRLPWSVVLDSAVCALGAAAVLAAFLAPRVDSASPGAAITPTAIALAFPLFDLLLVAVLVGIAASPEFRLGRCWLLLATGLLVFAATDIAYATLLLAGKYHSGTLLDAGWALGLTMVAVWVNARTRVGLRGTRSPRRTRALLVPAVTTVAVLVILLLATRVSVSPVALLLAAATLALAGVRTQLAFRQAGAVGTLRRLVLTDDLTGLANRRSFTCTAGTRLAARPDAPAAVLMLDLDRFKEVNDTFGHDVGDLLLAQVATRLLHEIDTADTLARLGGDDFALLLDDADAEQATATAQRLRLALTEPFASDGFTLGITASIGIAVAPGQGSDLTTLLRKADMAMYRAKATHSGLHVYVDADNAHSEWKLHTLQELRLALRTDQFILQYQPKVDLATGDVTGVEALVRWNHPTSGQLSPSSFLTVTEDAGLMPVLTDVVLTLALDQAVEWGAQGHTFSIAVNLSARSLTDVQLPDRIEAMLSARRLRPSALMLEITEEFLLEDPGLAVAILGRLRSIGLRVSLDNFGTGQSSLKNLRDLPIDELKLDRSFITPMRDNPMAAALVSSTIDLAHSSGLRIVAEGVEDSAIVEALTRYGCDEAQGYLMSHPVSPDELSNWLTGRRRALQKSASSSDFTDFHW
ncbi:bifunctional diguanylate cyclase/phosphodiesterase [Cryobacterium sp. MLB-32]|nr:EAL domain-containing protein [Cryobacterium sp. MLB-32]